MSFVPEKSINFSPTLAVTIGLEEAILLQLLQECLSHNDIRMEDGLRREIAGVGTFLETQRYNEVYELFASERYSAAPSRKTL